MFQDKTSRAIKGETGPCPDHVFSKSQETSPATHVQKRPPWRPVWSYVKWCSLPIRLSVNLCWLRDACVHTWEVDPEIYQIWAMNQANQNDWSKETWKRYPIKVIQTRGCDSSDSHPESSCVTVHKYCTFPLLINALLAPLFSIFAEILLCKAKGSGPMSLTTGLIARIWCFHCHNPAQFLVGNPRPTSRHCRPRPWRSPPYGPWA